MPKNIKILQANTSNDFAIPIDDETDLGIAFLIAEDASGAYEPVEAVSTIAEAREIATVDLRIRRSSQASGVFLPTAYVVWARGSGGRQRIAARIATTTL